MTVPVDDQLIIQVQEKIDHWMDRSIQGFGIPMLVIFEGAGFYELSPLS